MVDTFARQRTIIGTTANWTTNDLIIGDGEIAAERLSSGVIKLKVGDGIKKFSQLAYVEGQFNLTELDARYIQETEASTVGGTTGAGKVARLDGAGLLDDTMMPMTDLDVRYVQESETSGTGGLAAANKVPRLNGSGQLDSTLLPVAGFDGRYVQESETTKVGGLGYENLWPRLSADGMLDNSLLHIEQLEDHFVPIADTFTMGGPAAANKWPRLSSDGKLDGTLIRVSLLSYRGQIEASTTPAPVDPLNGDFYMQKTDGVVGPGWGAISGQPIGHGDFLNYSTTQGWQIFDSQIEPDAYLRIDGGIMAGKLVTKASDAASAGLRLLPGTSPTAPLDGDLWFTSTNLLARINGQTRAIMAQGGTGLFADGSAGQPSISFTNDPDTGIFRVADSSIGFTANAVEQMRLHPVNGLGIGTANPDVFARGFAKGISVSSTTHTGFSLNSGAAETSQIHLGSGGISNFHVISTSLYTGFTNSINGPLTFGTNNAERMRVSENGNVGIGSGNPGELLHIRSVASGKANILLHQDGGSSSPRVLFYGNANSSDRNWSIGSSGVAYGDFVFHVGTSAGAIPNKAVLSLTENYVSTPLNFMANGGVSIDSSNASQRWVGYAATSEKYPYDGGTVLHYGLSTGQLFTSMGGAAAGTALGGYAGIVFHTASAERMRIFSDGRVRVSPYTPNYDSPYYFYADGVASAHNFYTIPSTHALVATTSVGFSVPYGGDNFTIGARTGTNFATLWGWLGPNQNYSYIGQEWRIGGTGGYTGLLHGQMISARNDAIAPYHRFANTANNWDIRTGGGDNSFHIIDNQFGAYYVSCMGGKVGIRTPSPKGTLSIVGVGAPTTPQTVDSFFIGESSNHPDYHLKMGMAYGGGWVGAIDQIVAGAGGPLYLNPSGGPIIFGGPITFSAPIPIASGGTAASTALQAYLNLVAKARNYGKPGYIKLTDDLFIQWGEGTITGNATGTITFPVAYASFAVCIVGGGSATTGVEGSVRRYGSTSTAGQTIANSGADSATYGWIAIGV